MDTVETIKIEVYPWPAPTDEQRAWFGALSPEAKRQAIRDAIEEGFKSPISSKSIEEIIQEAHCELPNAP